MNSTTFNVFAIVGVISFYVLGAHIDHPMPDPKVEKDSLLRKALDSGLDEVERAIAAQSFCGNAGWKFSEKPLGLICIPRHGKPYEANPHVRTTK